MKEQLDADLRRNGLKLLAWYVAGVLVFTVGLMLLRGSIDLLRAFLAGNLLAMCGVVFLLSAWYGYQKWTGERARRTFVGFVASMFLGAVFVIAVDMVVHQRSIEDLA